MKKTRQKYNGILLLGLLLAFGLAGCGRIGTDTPATSLPTSTQIMEAMVTQESVVFPVEITDATFPEEVLRKKAQAADTDADGVLREEEAKTVTKLHLKKLADADAKEDREGEPLPEYTSEDFFFDFEGIQYFTELSELTVNLLGGEAFVEGKTEEILVVTKNFSRISECTKMKTLSLYEVDAKSLDISVFPNLKRLDLNDMYNLESVETGTHKKLSALWIFECHKLEVLDVSGLGELKTLDIVQNEGLKRIGFGDANRKLETIQLNGLPNLTEAEVSCLEHLKSLNLAEVGLTSLDVSGNTELVQLCAEGLRLDVLDLRKNPNISYLINAKDSFRSIIFPAENCVSMIRWTDSSVTEFPVKNLNTDTLTGIDIQGTAIKELDVSGYPKLEYLYYDEEVTKIKR